MEVLVAALFLTVAGERLADWLLKPVITALSPSLSAWLKGHLGEEQAQKLADYVEAIVCAVPGFAFSILARLDVFATQGVIFNPPVAGIIITAIFIGGGSNLTHIIVDRVQTSTASINADIAYWEEQDK
jgi:hypothetical protein